MKYAVLPKYRVHGQYAQVMIVFGSHDDAIEFCSSRDGCDILRVDDDIRPGDILDVNTWEQLR